MITIPTIAELKEDILADLQAQYGDSIPVFGKVFLNVLAGVQAAKLKLVYLAIASVQKNIFADTADPEKFGGTLERFGRIKLGRNPFPATAGQYTVNITGTVGAIISAGTTFKSNDDSSNPSKLYILDSPFELESSPDSMTLRALTPGLDGALEAGDELTCTSPLPEADEIVEVTAETVEPLSAEDIEDYRDNIIESYRLEPQGGAGADYRLWASDVQGVQQTYPYAKPGVVGEVDLYVEATVADSTDSKGTPSQDILNEVAEVIDLDPDDTKPMSERGRRPLTAIVNLLAITPLDVEIDIADYIGSTSEIEDAIESALGELISGIRPFVSDVDILEERNDVIDTNRIIAKILEAFPGSYFGVVTLTVNSVVVTEYTFENGDIPHLDSVTFS